MCVWRGLRPGGPQLPSGSAFRSPPGCAGQKTCRTAPDSADRLLCSSPGALSFAGHGVGEGARAKREWAIRLVPIGCSILSVWLLWDSRRQCDRNKSAAALPVALFATLPMELHYGELGDYEPCLVMWMLAALLCLRNWEVRTRRPGSILGRPSVVSARSGQTHPGICSPSSSRFRFS